MPASRFHDGRRGASYIARVFIFGRELRILNEDNAPLAVWKLAGVTAAPEVDPDGMVMLTARDHPGVLLVGATEDLDTLRHAGIRLPGRQVWTRGHWVAVCAGLLAAVGLFVLVLTALPLWLTAAIPIAWERRLGEPAEALMTASNVRCTGPEGQAALDRLVARLRAAGSIEMPVTISVLDDKTINAFTLPGGHVLVMHGLIEDTTDGPMLAGVIAHELGHVAHRDPTTLLLRSMGLSVLLHLLGFGDAGGTAAGGASDLMSLAYTRAAESAADDTAIMLLTGAGLRADGLSRFFARMEHRAQGPGLPDHGVADHRETGTMLDWLASHPSSAARRERTARPESGEPPFTDAEWQAIRSMCVPAAG